MKKRSLKILSVILSTALVVLGTAACGSKTTSTKDVTDYASYDYVNANASVSAATTGSVHNFVAESYAERTEILALLEKYAMENTISGLVLYDNGGYVKYSDRVKFGTNAKKNSDGSVQQIAGTTQYEYLTGYGFGIFSEGGIEGKLPGIAANSPYASYYHTYETEDPKTLNYMNDKGSVVGSYHGYVSSGYFGTKMNDAKTGYVWYPSTATEANKLAGETRPLPLTADGQLDTNATLSTVATKYRIYVRTGSDFKYAIATKKAELAAFNGREVKLEDYLVPFKELYNQSNGLARGAEGLTGAGSIKGMEAYHTATSEGFDQAAWDAVGIKTGTDATGSYLDFEFNVGCTPFYAMYYLASSLYAPIPAEFLEKIGGIAVWGSFNGDNTLTPVDTTLSTSVFVVEEWNVDGEFVFKNNTALNPAVKGGDHLYTLDGLHVDILKAALQDSLAAWNEYAAGRLDSVGIPKDKLATEKTTPGTQLTSGSSSTKLNVNTCTEEEWEKFFGENGTITQTQKSDYWKVEPALSNPDFVNGLSWAINRDEFATNLGATPSIEYFSANYLSNPEEGISYNTTEAHKKVMESIYGPTWADTYGYDLDKAIELFNKAATQWLADGTYKEGQTIEIEIAWMSESSIKTSGEPIAKYLEDAFNNAAVCNNKLTLKINNMSVVTWTDVYYKKMMVGQFDIAIGGISGNTLNPLNFMEVLKSDNSSGFTLNWGPDTNGDACIEYKGVNYTYDALWKAADAGALVDNDGKLAKTHDAVLAKNVRNEDGSRTVEIKYAATNIKDVIEVKVDTIICCWYDGDEYAEQAVEFTAENGVITIQISQELAESYQGAIGFDVIFTEQYGSDKPVEQMVSLYSEFPVLEWE